MLILSGSKLADTHFDKVSESLSSVSADISHFSFQYDYLIDTDTAMDDTQLSALQKLLEASSVRDHEPSCFWVIPRVGTVSPWSSKATELIQKAGILGVRRIEQALRVSYQSSSKLSTKKLQELKALCFDRMTQTTIDHLEQAQPLFEQHKSSTFESIPLLEQGYDAFREANQRLGLALSDSDMDYLVTFYESLKRNPSDAELMMFAQVNSEHCRHKIFKAQWVLDGIKQPNTLFDMIKNTYKVTSENIWSAYHDNAAVLAGFKTKHYHFDPKSYQFCATEVDLGIVIKVETHNHPTAIAPFEGAGTGSGGEIRDEGATGRGGKPKAGLTGFSVSHLQIPGLKQDFEQLSVPVPHRICTPLDIMLKAPIGGAQYNNEFGRPNLCGYFRSFEYTDPIAGCYGYHKPIMIAGGLGQIRKQHVEKKSIPEGSLVVVLGGPALNIGLGGGAASSMQNGDSSEDLDFASVQRQNPEMQRRAQEVIDSLVALGEDNPILSIHDVGAGGLSNAIPELVEGGGQGAVLNLRAIPNAEPGMSPMAIWCCEAQERYVLAIEARHKPLFENIAQRERCPYAFIGTTQSKQQLVVHDSDFNNHPVDVPLELLLGGAPPVTKVVDTHTRSQDSAKQSIPLAQALENVLQHPTVGDKSFLITIGDRSVGGLVYRDQMVGPWQVPVADCAVTSAGFESSHGEAMAMGERGPIAVLNPKASARMAVAESITNLLAAPVAHLSDIKLSCNWIAACGEDIEDQALFEAVQAVGVELCPELGIAVPVGKDSLSMRTKSMVQSSDIKAPMTLVVSAFSPVETIRNSLTPELMCDKPSTLWFIDLAQGQQRMGGSCYQHLQNHLAGQTPEVSSEALLGFFKALKQLKQKKLIKAYHDRSDGGLWASLCEMAFASHVGLDIQLDRIAPSKNDALCTLLNEELGVVVQVLDSDQSAFLKILDKIEVIKAYPIARVQDSELIRVFCQEEMLFEAPRQKLHQLWSSVSHTMQRLRDDAACADSAYEALSDTKGLQVHVPFKIAPSVLNLKPKVAVLREQGINGQLEMAYAFHKAGFEAVDVTMQDLWTGKVDLSKFQALAACGGFSYGDVLGAGVGWAQSILSNPKLCDQFSAFFQRLDTLTLGVCNGCQMLASLKSIIPGASEWPAFVQNKSQQFEARLSLVNIVDSASLWLEGMDTALLPIVVSHGEGRIELNQTSVQSHALGYLSCLHYVDPNSLQPTERYPYNPNGSPQGVAGLTSLDGRVTVMMPHPERCVRTLQMSWHPPEWDESTPWQQMFYNAANHFQ